MENNLFISYDLNSPGQDYSTLMSEIKSLGRWAKVQKSFWYVNASLTAAQVKDKLIPHIDTNDSLIVIDASNNSAAWYGLSDKVANHIKTKWTR
jgi:hypothetical protein